MGFICRNMEVCTWSHEDMPGISPKKIVNVHNIDPAMKPVKQKRRKFASEKVKAIIEEVKKLIKAQFI